jgi:type II secretory pathway pseudopilin PulG
MTTTKAMLIQQRSTQGFTLIEAAVGIVIIGAMSALMFPLFVGYKTLTVKNDIRLGASAVSQRVIDDLRRANVRNLPTSGTFESLPAPPDGTGESTSLMTYKGKTYRVAITYCNPSTECDATTRRILVRTYFGDDTLPTFQLETLYTEMRN